MQKAEAQFLDGQDKYEEMAQADRKLSQGKMRAVIPLTCPSDEYLCI